MQLGSQPNVPSAGPEGYEAVEELLCIWKYRHILFNVNMYQYICPGAHVHVPCQAQEIESTLSKARFADKWLHTAFNPTRYTLWSCFAQILSISHNASSRHAPVTAPSRAPLRFLTPVILNVDENDWSPIFPVTAPSRPRHGVFFSATNLDQPSCCDLTTENH